MTSIGGELYIRNIDAMDSLSGLDNIDAASINNLHITYNNFLSTCEVQSVCDYLVSPGATIEIHNNARGCNSQAEVDTACAHVWIPDIDFDSEFSIYPNPTKDILSICFKDGATIKEVVIYNQLGQKVFEGELINNTINVSNLQQGMYIVELIGRDWRLSKKLIVKSVVHPPLCNIVISSPTIYQLYTFYIPSIYLLYQII